MSSSFRSTSPRASLRSLQALRAQPFGDAQRRKRAEFTQKTDAPTRQRIGQFGRGRKHGDWQIAQKLGLVAIRDYADAGKAARRADGGIGIGGDGDARLYAHLFGAPRDGRRDILRESE